MQQHIDQIARENGVEIIYDEDSDGWAWRNRSGSVRQICIQHLGMQKYPQVEYFVAMHEFGHVLGPGGWHNPHLLVREARAWEWAIKNALMKPTISVRAEIRNCLGNYYDEQHSRMKKGQHVVWPTADEPFWDLLESGVLAA